jgi:hypothetical protein
MDDFCLLLWEEFSRNDLIKKDEVPTLLLSAEQYAHVRKIAHGEIGIRKDAHIFMCRGVMVQEDTRE